MAPSVLVLNAGSSSIKFQLFAIDNGAPLRQYRGKIDGIGTQPRMTVADAERVPVFDQTFDPADVANVPGAIEVLGRFLREHLAERLPIAVGHRVVHGGPDLDRPLLVDDDIVDKLQRCIPLAPLHQPNNLAPIEAIREQLPDMPQVVCFDTAFHRGHSEVADRYAIPDELHQLGARRYGFHGLSYEFIARVLPEAAPEIAGGRVIAAHLGSGASMCAMQDGQSVDSSMGFTGLDGLPMGTRPGQIDPGIVLLLITHRGMSPQEVEHMLYHESGLKGISGISNDVRDLLASDDPRAQLALDVFAFRAAKEVGGLTSVLGGLDALVFTAGIGENAPEIRRNICDRLTWLGIALDDDANNQNATLISRQGATPRVYVIPTDEDYMIALHTLQTLNANSEA